MAWNWFYNIKFWVFKCSKKGKCIHRVRERALESISRRHSMEAFLMFVDSMKISSRAPPAPTTSHLGDQYYSGEILFNSGIFIAFMALY